MSPNPVTAGGARRGEAGSAYVLALVVLAILSIVGLSLAFITQSEMQVGSNERMTSRIFYSADSGIAVATANVLVAGDYRPKSYTLPEDGRLAARTSLGVEQRVNVSMIAPLYDGPCNLCEINNLGTYNDRAYRKMNHGVTSTAVRTAGGGSELLSQKTVAAQIEIQPWRPTIDTYLLVNDPAELAKVKF